MISLRPKKMCHIDHFKSMPSKKINETLIFYDMRGPSSFPDELNAIHLFEGIMGKFSDIIYEKRSETFRSAKAFWEAKRPGCSYYQYILIEKGKDLPSTELAFDIAELLSISIRKAMYAWAYDSMPSPSLSKLFESDDDFVLPDVAEVRALAACEPPLIVNRMQANLLQKNVKMYEILSFMTTYVQQKKSFSESEISRALASSVETIKPHLIELYEHGLIDRIKPGEYTCKINMTIPSETDLEPLQRTIFYRSLSCFDEAGLAGKKQLRATLTRLLSLEQIAIVEQKFKALRNWVWSLPEPISKDAKPYVLGIFGSERGFK